ncbi:MAG: hypothetical protein L0Y79_04390 [Chlorobi bacterium]|nr:hypothetical protein [Chlorobiota bacterium]MCI0716354.1 hypothetical protein [Chlorobiota bacterium]
METKQAEQELSLIKQMMIDSRRVVVDSGKHYIFWGILITAALLVNYYMLLTHQSGKFIGLMWLITIVSGFLIDSFIERSNIRKRRVHTFAGKILSALWIASGIAMSMIGFIGPLTKAYNPIFICPIISVILGVSYFASGAIQQVKWLQWLTLGWWAGAIITFVFPSIHTLLIFALMLIFFQTIPGMILYKKWKSANLEIE